MRQRHPRIYHDEYRIEMRAHREQVEAWDKAAEALSVTRSEWMRSVLDAAASPCKHEGADLDLLPGPSVRLRCRRCGVVLEPRSIEQPPQVEP